jgi:hypothetical protein
MHERARVDVRTIKGPDGVRNALREVIKYATKGEKGERSQATHAAAVELAFRNVHRVGLGGAVRGIKLTDSHGSTEDAKPSDFLDDHAMACESCGVIGEWTWVQRLSADQVNAHGGFGWVRQLDHDHDRSG